MNKIKALLEQLNDRERGLLMLASAMLVVYLVYAALYSPLTNKVTQKKLMLIEQQQILQWMKAQSLQYKHLKIKQKLGNDEILSVISERIKKSNLNNFSYQLEQTNNDDIQLIFDEVPYTYFIAWLEEFVNSYSISVKQLYINNKSTPGIVDVKILMFF